jgi:N-acetyl-gamma-glutamyl-phosphate reductase
MKKISIAGATGYTGIELLRLLVKHPEVEIVTLTAESHAGKNIAEVAPSLQGWVDQTLVKLSPPRTAAHHFDATRTGVDEKRLQDHRPQCRLSTA